MYLTPTAKHWIIDIETDSLDATVIWVMCAKNAKTKEKRTFIGYEEIKKFFDEHSDCYFVGHNIIKFDAPVLNRLAGTRLAVNRLVDTFVLSSLYAPNLPGGHSLEAWGERVNCRKYPFKEFHKLSDEMIVYCEQDVEVTDIVFDRLTARMLQVGFTEKSCELEHRAWNIIKKQQANGFAFNYRGAHELFTELRAIEADLKERIYHAFPPQLLCVAEYKKARKIDGSKTAAFERHEQQYSRLELSGESGYRAYDFVEFNLGSPKQRVEKLLELGWEPGDEERTPTGNPKPTKKGELVPSLAEFAETSGITEVKLIATWMAINSRANAISNWMDLCNQETGCIHGNLWLASTLRYRHDKPNTANVPAVRTKKTGEKDEAGEAIETPLLGLEGFYTYESRGLWVTRDPTNRSLVGVDAKGIQLRVLAHYINNEQFTKNILSSDPHLANQKLIGLSSRPLTKTITYATLMGAGDKRIASEAKITLKEAKAAKKKFFNTVDGLKRLIDRLKTELKRTGRITLCDGSRLLVPSDHMVIPYLLQGDESRIMKQAAIYVDELVRKEKLDVLKVGDIHDEWQSDVADRDVGRYIQICEESFSRAGRVFHYNLPIECSAKVGKNWAETH